MQTIKVPPVKHLRILPNLGSQASILENLGVGETPRVTTGPWPCRVADAGASWADHHRQMTKFFHVAHPS